MSTTKTLKASGFGRESHLAVVRSLNDRYRYYKTVESLFELDSWSGLPRDGFAYRQQAAAFIDNSKAALFDEPEAKAAAQYFSGMNLDECEDYIERGLVRSFLFRYNNQTKMPKDLMYRYNMARADTIQKWNQARAEKDFRIFAPSLKQVFDLKKAIAEAVNPDQPAFDTLVGMTDEGMKTAEIDREFDLLKAGIIELMKKIKAAGETPARDIFAITLDQERIEKFSRRLAVEAGYCEERGGFNDRVVHAFTSFLGPLDSRVSMHKTPNLNMVFTALHESGHAMYATGGNAAVNAANMWGGIEGSFQEGMARFQENMLGRSRAYWQHYYPQLQAEFCEFRDIPFEEFCASLNRVTPSTRRITADEVTYNLHVIIRYELEREYFAGNLSVEDLPSEWNDLSEKYLGVRPNDDVEGILQDMHWAGDYIGYFQSYAMGNIYCGQLRERVLRDIPDFEEQIRDGKFSAISAWLDENIRQYGCCFTAGEMAERVTGSRLDAKPFLKYLNDKLT